MEHPLSASAESVPTGDVAGSDPALLLAAARDAFDASARAAGRVTDLDFRFGELTIRFRFAGPELIPFIMPAFEHLRAVPGGEPMLTVHLWHGVAAGAALRLPSWLRHDEASVAEIRGFINGRLRAAFQPECSITSLLDLDQGDAFYWVQDVAAIPYYESGAPMLRILHWWLRDHGYHLVHAAAVGLTEGAALLVGRGGSGKSTAALACFGSQLRYLADDYCALSTGPEPSVSSLFSSAKQEAGNLWRFPRLGAAVSNPEKLAKEKALLFLHGLDPAAISRRFPLRHILLPRVTGRKETVVVPASPAAAFRALAPSTLFQLRDRDHSASSLIADIVRRFPCYYLDTGTDLSRIPGVIEDLLLADGRENRPR
jgi:hypothetical protein